MPKFELHSLEALQLAIKVSTLLDGLYVGQALRILDETRCLLLQTNPVNVNGEGFRSWTEAELQSAANFGR